VTEMRLEESGMRNGVRVLGHPVHPMLTDFPIALWSASLLGDFMGIWRGEVVYREFAFWAITLGLVMAVPTIFTGLIDYASIPQGHPALRVAVWHMSVMLSAAAAYTGSLITRIGQTAPTELSSGVAIGLSVLGLILLLAGGWFGGELVFHHGIGSRGDRMGSS
jgi:uncharacterized membrane protein